MCTSLVPRKLHQTHFLPKGVWVMRTQTYFLPKGVWVMRTPHAVSHILQ